MIYTKSKNTVLSSYLILWFSVKKYNEYLVPEQYCLITKYKSLI